MWGVKMRRILFAIFSVIIVLSCSGCNGSIVNEFPNDLLISDDSVHTVIELSPDWPSYDTASEIVEASTNIYIGKVKDITFDIINMETGKSDNSQNSNNANRMLYTIYTVSVLENFKGDNSEDVKICQIGGIWGYKEDEQIHLLESAGLLQDFGGIPVIKDGSTLAISADYLFCTSRTIGDFDFIINKNQFAHKLDSQNYKLIISAIE